ncbi:hypothetical protein [Mucilaginibacter sp.]|uniref:hypothetical protein n=1 Tax=Mucilaginibacter sp. TaxID=1882438 RepID=UPI0026350673|nr:hypothetical protein [Mucilaginibacter sp.]MDB5032270.1 hypothetical protein [Mucilaginibacter sp.]
MPKFIAITPNLETLPNPVILKNIVYKAAASLLFFTILDSCKSSPSSVANTKTISNSISKVDAAKNIDSSEDLRVIVKDDPANINKKYLSLKGYLDLRLISKSEYENKKSTVVDYLLRDTINIKKIKGVIELPYQNGIKRYKDLDEGENYNTYKYVGQFLFFNKYLIHGEYDATESGDYSLIDKTTGVVTSTFKAFPHISNDKKYLIGVMSNFEMDATDLELYKINGDSVKTILTVSFKNWLPLDDEKAMFWATDGCFYVPIAYPNISNEKNTYSHYLKISVL